MENKTFIVLGMHRSATSLIAKGLHEAGVNMGDDGSRKQYRTNNSFYEDMDFVLMNRKLLRKAGGSWKNPPPREKIIKIGCIHKQSIERLIKRKNKGLWGWKDPRTVLTLECYLPWLDDVHLITVFRDRRQVAKSMYKRDRNDKEISMEKALELADEYNKRLIDLLNNYKKSWLS